MSRAGAIGLATAVPGAGMVMPCALNASWMGVPATAAAITAASCGLGAVPIGPGMSEPGISAPFGSSGSGWSGESLVAAGVSLASCRGGSTTGSVEKPGSDDADSVGSPPLNGMPALGAPPPHPIGDTAGAGIAVGGGG